MKKLKFSNKIKFFKNCIQQETDSSIDNDTSAYAPKPLPLLQSPIVWICVALVIICLIAIVGAFLTCKTSKKSEPELAPLAPSTCGGPGYSSNMYNVDNLKLIAMIGQGKYGTVWRGMINEQTVAVKIFPSQHKQYFQNEKNIYSLPLMQMPSILQYFGYDTRRTLTDNIEYILVLSLAPLGCLQDWLIENTCSFEIFTKMAKSVSRGLSHLHSAQRKDDLEKPCVCHRDLNTRNILVKADLSCCISDFGFALKTFGPRYEWNGEIALAETKSINEVGTLRYMAPEVLEGAVNLRDCETALKQIDVYSLGLVLWELCVRCHDWYPNDQLPPAYKSPYEAEVGKKPSFEHMQILISRHKARPVFPSNWGEDSAGKIARETCEDCWDHDAEARLTALCVEERIHELTSMHSRASSSCGSPSTQLSTNNLIAATTSGNNVVITTATGVKTKNSNFYANTAPETSTITPPNQIVSNINPNNALTNVRNVLPSSDHKNLDNYFTQQIQRNNLIPSSHNMKTDQTKVFLEKSTKKQKNFCDFESSHMSIEELLGDTTSSSSSSVIIPNATVMGKELHTDRKFKGWYGVRAMIQKKLFKRYSNRMQTNNQIIDDKRNLVDSNNIFGINSSTTTSPKYNGIVKQQHIIPTPPTTTSTSSIYNGNKLTNTQQIVTIRPKNLNLPMPSKNENFKCPPGDNTSQSFTIIKHNPQIIVSRSANSMNSHDGNNTLNVIDERHLKRQRSLEMFHEVFGSKGSIDRLRDPSQRVKTPGDVPPSVRKIRASKTLSLYDDRMMDTSSRNSL